MAAATSRLIKHVFRSASSSINEQQPRVLDGMGSITALSVGGDIRTCDFLSKKSRHVGDVSAGNPTLWDGEVFETV